MMNGAITVSKAKGKQGLGLTEDAERLAKQIGLPFLPREQKSIPTMFKTYQLDALAVEEEHCLQVHWVDGQKMTFHPGMAIPRIKQWKLGHSDPLRTAWDLHPEDQILDCTMGLASDALVAAFGLRGQGCVTALESSPLIYLMTAYGLRHWTENGWRLQEAMHRIHPNYSTYQSFLSAQPENTFDVVYFDPMFDRPILRSSGIAPLRREANPEPLTSAWLHEALRVARRRVVVKHRVGTLRQLSFDAILGGTYSTIAYGILQKKEG